MNGAALAFAALLSIAAGPLPREKQALTVGLCGGGAILIPLGNGDEPERNCDPTACHAATCREKVKERLPGAKGRSAI